MLTSARFRVRREKFEGVASGMTTKYRKRHPGQGSNGPVNSRFHVRVYGFRRCCVLCVRVSQNGKLNGRYWNDR